MSEGDKNVNKLKRKLVIKEGAEFKIKVEGLEKFNNSFFKDIYDSAAVNVGEIIDNTKKYYSVDKKFKKDKEEANNIIAFVGERGTGKSSAMVSFAEALKYINDKDTNLDKSGLEKFKELEDVSFVNLDIIDPALLEDKESIFEIIIAKMFSKFKEQMENQSDTLEYDDKKRLLKKFQKVYMDLKTINTDRKDMLKESPYSEDIIETLISLASGSNMRKSFIELVDEFLEMFSNEKDKDKRFLVIPIDDLDMNIKHSAEMAEQIRKYLMVPNVIVLMAIKMGQLKDSIEQMYRENYAVMLKEGNLSDDPKEMAERYIEKLIPNGRKLYLPDIRVHKDGMEENILLEFDDTDWEENHKKDELKSTEEDGDSIEDIVLKMTYEKTGLIFIKNDYDVHYLVPDNLRELQNYLIMLNKMENIKLNFDGKKDKEKDKELRLHNLEKFETYFFKNWVKRNLPRKYIKIINEFYGTPIGYKNKFVITVLNKIFSSELRKNFDDNMWKEITISRRFRENSIYNDIFSLDNNPRNVSLGDVLDCLQLYKDFDTEELKKLKFAIKTIYSIIIYKLLFISDSRERLMELIGGDIFGGIGEKFLPRDRTSLFFGRYSELNIKNGNEIINVSEVLDEIIDYVATDLKDQCTVYGSHPHLDEDQYSTIKYSSIIEWLNYFMYFPSKERGENYRNSEYVVYKNSPNLRLGNIERSGKFNIFAFIFFLIDPEENLKRIFMPSIQAKLNKDMEEEYLDDNIGLTCQRILDNIESEYSITKEITDWRDSYKCVLPIYSIEVLELIANSLRMIKTENKIKWQLKLEDKNEIPYYDNGFTIVLKNILPQIIEELVLKNKFLEVKNNNDKVCLVKKSYKECPIISFYFDKNKDKNNNVLIERDMVKNVINDIYLKSDIAKDEININNHLDEEVINNIIETLESYKQVCKRWLRNNITIRTVINRINKIIDSEYYKFLSLDFKTKLLNNLEKLKSIDEKLKFQEDNKYLLEELQKIISDEIYKLSYEEIF